MERWIIYLWIIGPSDLGTWGQGSGEIQWEAFLNICLSFLRHCRRQEAGAEAAARPRAGAGAAGRRRQQLEQEQEKKEQEQETKMNQSKNQDLDLDLYRRRAGSPYKDLGVT